MGRDERHGYVLTRSGAFGFLFHQYPRCLKATIVLKRPLTVHATAPCWRAWKSGKCGCTASSPGALRSVIVLPNVRRDRNLDCRWQRKSKGVWGESAMMANPSLRRMSRDQALGYRSSLSRGRGEESHGERKTAAGRQLMSEVRESRDQSAARWNKPRALGRGHLGPSLLAPCSWCYVQ